MRKQGEIELLPSGNRDGGVGNVERHVPRQVDGYRQARIEKKTGSLEADRAGPDTALGWTHGESETGNAIRVRIRARRRRNHPRAAEILGVKRLVGNRAPAAIEELHRNAQLLVGGHQRICRRDNEACGAEVIDLDGEVLGYRAAHRRHRCAHDARAVRATRGEIRCNHAAIEHGKRPRQSSLRSRSRSRLSRGRSLARWRLERHSRRRRHPARCPHVLRPRSQPEELFACSP